MNSGGALDFVLGGPGQFSQLAVKNTIQLGGRLNVALTNGYTPAIGTQFEIITNSGNSSSFASINVPHGISVTYSNSGVYLTITSAVPAQVVSPQILGNNFTFDFATVNGQSYTVQQNSNLASPNWTYFTNITGNGSLYQVVTPLTNFPWLSSASASRKHDSADGVRRQKIGTRQNAATATLRQTGVRRQ